MASTVQQLNDTTELVELLNAQRLYLKPVSRLNITVQLPALKDPTKTISNWDIMEKLKRLIAPINFSSIKVSKSSLEFVRFEAEVDNRETLQKTVKSLDNAVLKVIGFFDTLKVKASEAKSEFPTKHMWDAYFRDAKNVDETKPGERPDTVYLDKLPSKWFQDLRPNRGQSNRGDQTKPSEFVLRRVFEVFGDIRCVDIPQLDVSRTSTTIPMMQPKPMVETEQQNIAITGQSMKSFNFGSDFTFDAYVQYVEYIGFVKAMDALRNMKLVYIDDEEKALAANIKVDFDRSKHLSDKNIRKRRIFREKFIRDEKIRVERLRREEAEKRQKAEEERLRSELEKKLVEKRVLDRRRGREEKRKIKKLEQKRREEEGKIEEKIRREEHKLVVAQRKLESIRLLGDLFKLVKPRKMKEKVEQELRALEEAQRRENEKKLLLKREEERNRDRLLRKKESELREKVLRNYNDIAMQREDYKREQLRKMVKSNGAQLSSVVTATSNPYQKLRQNIRISSDRYAPYPQHSSSSSYNKHYQRQHQYRSSSSSRLDTVGAGSSQKERYHGRDMSSFRYQSDNRYYYQGDSR